LNTENTPSHTTPAEPVALHSRLPFALVLSGLTLLTGAVTGSLSALFWWSLDGVTALRLAHPQLLLALPLAGILTVWTYKSFGKGTDRGNDLILERLHHGTTVVPARIAPLVFGGSLLSHCFARWRLGGADAQRSFAGLPTALIGSFPL
jgi:H+/Cl- antiporter ClcA